MKTITENEKSEIIKDFQTKKYYLYELSKKYSLSSYIIKNIIKEKMEDEDFKLSLSEIFVLKQQEKINEWIEKEQKKHLKCKCGCNQDMIIRPCHFAHGVAEYLPGHSKRNQLRNKSDVQNQLLDDYNSGNFYKRDLCKRYDISRFILDKILKDNQKEGNIEYKRTPKNTDLKDYDLEALKNDFLHNKKTIHELTKFYKKQFKLIKEYLVEEIGEETYNKIIKNEREERIRKGLKNYHNALLKRKAELLWELEEDFDWNQIYTNLDRFEEVELSEEKIIVDSIERNEYIFKNLNHIKRRLWICDYYIWGHPHVIIERKTIPDLYQSLKDGRLWNQLKMMGIFPSYPSVIFPAVLVEGEYRETSWWVKKKFKEWQFENLLNIIRFKWQIAVIRSKDEKDTVSILKAIQYAVKPKKKSGKQFYITPIKKKDKSAVEIRIAILMTIEGVGENTAIKLLQKYGTIGNMLKASKISGDDKILQRMDILYRG